MSAPETGSPIASASKMVLDVIEGGSCKASSKSDLPTLGDKLVGWLATLTSFADDRQQSLAQYEALTDNKFSFSASHAVYRGPAKPSDGIGRRPFYPCRQAIRFQLSAAIIIAAIIGLLAFVSGTHSLRRNCMYPIPAAPQN